MTWWIVGVVFGVIVVGVSLWACYREVPALQSELLTLQEHKEAAFRLKNRLDALQPAITEIQEKLPNR